MNRNVGRGEQGQGGVEQHHVDPQIGTTGRQSPEWDLACPQTVYFGPLLPPDGMIHGAFQNGRNVFSCCPYESYFFLAVGTPETIPRSLQLALCSARKEG